MRLTEITQRKYDLWYGPERSITEDYAHERTYLANGVSYDEVEDIAKKKLFDHKLGVIKGPEGTDLEIRKPVGPGRDQADGDIGIATIWGISYTKDGLPPTHPTSLYILLCAVPAGWTGY